MTRNRGNKKEISHLAKRILIVLVVQIFLFVCAYPGFSQESDVAPEKGERAADLHPKLRESAHKLFKAIENGEAIEKHLDEMMGQVDAIEAEGDEIETRFREIEEKMPFSPIIIARHQKAVRTHHENLRLFKEMARELRIGRDRKESPLRIKQKAGELIQFIEKNRTKKFQLLGIENRLPWRLAESGNILLLGDASTIPQAAAPVVPTLPPSGNDLSPTLDVQITPEIQELANSLDNHPLKIFRYIYNNYDYTPYYGSVKGSLDTFYEKEGNDYDLSSLLIALLRASNIPARYVRVKIIIPIDKVMKWLDFNDPKAALDYLSSARIPSGYYTQGNQITHAGIEHVYVEAYVPYANYRGTTQDDRGKLWIPMDPSFKMYKVTQEGIDIASEMGFEWQTFTDAHLDIVSNITPIQHYQKKIDRYLASAHPGQTVDSLKRTTEISKLQFDFLPGTLPFQVTEVLERFSETPSGLRHSLRFTIPGSLDFAATLPEVSGRRLTLSFEAATAEDQAVIDRYGDIFETPPYLIEVKPVLRVNGTKVKEGTAMAAGLESPFSIEYHQTGQVMDVYYHNVMTGSINAVGITTGKVRPEYLTISQVEESEERYLPKMLHSLAMKYHNNENETKKTLNNTMKMRSKTYFAEVLLSTRETIKSTFGVPITFELSGYMIDAKEICVGVTPVDGYDKKKIMNFMMVRGFESSAQESRVFEDNMFWLSGLSAVRGLQLLKSMKIQITELVPPMTYSNPNLHEVVVEDINNALNMGWHVIVPEDTGELGGIPYIKYDPNTGSGAYMLGVIAGGTSKYQIVNRNFDDYVKAIPPDGAEIVGAEFYVTDPPDGKAFIWGDIFDAYITMKLTLKEGNRTWIDESTHDEAGNPWKMRIHTGPYKIYDDQGHILPGWEEPGFYNLMYNGTSVYTFYVWGPVLDYINSDKYIGISRINDADTADPPVTIRYSIKEMEGVTITSSRMQICDQNESVLMEIENIPVGENQEIVWDGKYPNGEIFPPGEYRIKIVSVGNGIEVPTKPHKVVVFKVEIINPSENADNDLTENKYISTLKVPFRARILPSDSHLKGNIKWNLDREYDTSISRGPWNSKKAFETKSDEIHDEVFTSEGGRVKINATVVFDTIPSISNIYVTITGPDAIPDSMITDQLVTLYKNGATPRLMTGIAMQESSYMQFRNFTLFNRADKWPNESYDGGSHIGLMMVVPNLTRAWNWFNNTNEGVNLFVNQKLAFSRTYVNRKILEQSKIGITLRDLTPVEHENNALVFYGPFASATEHYYELNSQGTDWIINTTGNPSGVQYANSVRAKMK